MDYLVDIIGQEKAVEVLRRALTKDTINHAYLFIGPAGTGKKTAALAFAQSLILRSDPQGEAYWEEKAHPDFMYIEKPEGKTSILIEQINREMEPWLAMKPYRASHRVVVINDAHLLNLPAANALLKTLEEPPGQAVIILVADEQILLETIVSRCQIIRFAPLSETGIALFLQQRGMEQQRAIHLARLAQGSLTTALQLADADELEDMWNTAWGLVEKLAGSKEVEIFKCAEEMEKNPVVMTNLLTTLLRDIYIFQTTQKKELLVVDSNLPRYEQFKRLDRARVRTALQNIDERKLQYRGPVRSLLLSVNISYQLHDALK